MPALVAVGILFTVVASQSGDPTLEDFGGGVGLFVTMAGGALCVVSSVLIVAAWLRGPRQSTPAVALPLSVPEARLDALKRMRAAGDLTDEEYEAKRAEIVSQL